MSSIPSASTSSPPPRWKYDVFLSFRGEDTRLNFVDHLYDALARKGIVTFRDDKSLERGNAISSELLKAIEESKFALVILSPNYASSSWCLDELLKIIQCREEKGQLVMPVFYQVDPSHVRKNKGYFLQAFTEHEEVHWENRDKIRKWRAALTDVANLSGWDLRNAHEAKAINDIVSDILNKSQYTSTSIYKGMVGMDNRVDDLLRAHIRPRFHDVRMIGIHGMRGIGKTAVARALYDQLCQDFDSSCEPSNVRDIFKKCGMYPSPYQIGEGFDRCCFLSNVREMSKIHGLVSLQEKLLSRILKATISNIEDEYAGANMIQRRLGKMRVLLVIDDVDQVAQLENLAGSRNWFGPGSRIIITSADVHLLNGVDTKYEAAVLTYNEALQLLSLKAFKINHPPEDYLELCNNILGYAHGLPLALVVIGSFLCGRFINEWKSAIERLRNKPERSIIDVLQISFDGLRDTEKEIFLYVACFYVGNDKDRVSEMLDYCQLYPDIGLSVLADKSLITISNNELSMHALLQEMGREIVRRESPNDPGKRSRLWFHEDIHNVLKKNKGTEAVQGMVMDLPKLELANWNPEAFSNLSELKFLQIRNVDLPNGLTCLSNSLRLLEWSGYPLRSLPQYFEPDELIELNLCHSKIEQLWEGVKYFDKLKFIKLCHSQNIVQTPDLTGVQNLESLDLEGCKNLVGMHRSLGLHKKLIVLNLKDCESLESLPGRIEMESLKTLILSGCSKIKKIPEFRGNMECLSELHLDGTAIEKLPGSIERLSGLSSLDLSNCKNLVCLPSTIKRFRSLKFFNLSGCLKLRQQERSVGEMDCLQENDASGSAVTELPSSNILLKHVKDSISHGCEVVQKSLNKLLPSRLMQMLNTVPMSSRLSLSGLCNLTDLNISNCNLGDTAFGNSFYYLPSLVALNLSGNNFVCNPSGIRFLSKLENINLENCKKLQVLSDLPSNSKLDVRADGCSSLESLFDISNYNGLEKSYFSFINCFKLINEDRYCINIAFEMLKIVLQQGISNAKETFQIVFPGSGIPRWFKYEGNGGSVRLLIAPESPYTSRFMGFALCVVFVIDERHQVDELDIHHFKTFNATHHLVCYLKLNGIELEGCGRQPAFRFSEEFCQVESDHRWLFYVASDKYFGIEEHDRCSQIELLFETRGPGLKVKKCGLRMIFEKDVQDLNSCTRCTQQYGYGYGWKHEPVGRKKLISSYLLSYFREYI